jgi:hypothetical protein
MHSTSRTSKLSGLAAANELVRLGGPKRGWMELLIGCVEWCFCGRSVSFQQFWLAVRARRREATQLARGCCECVVHADMEYHMYLFTFQT